MQDRLDDQRKVGPVQERGGTRQNGDDLIGRRLPARHRLCFDRINAAWQLDGLSAGVPGKIRSTFYPPAGAQTRQRCRQQRNGQVAARRGRLQLGDFRGAERPAEHKHFIEGGFAAEGAELIGAETEQPVRRDGGAAGTAGFGQQTVEINLGAGRFFDDRQMVPVGVVETRGDQLDDRSGVPCRPYPDPQIAADVEKGGNVVGGVV